MMKCPKCGNKKTPKQIHEELQSWDKLVGNEEYDQGYVLGFRMALKWTLGLKPKAVRRNEPERLCKVR